MTEFDAHLVPYMKWAELQAADPNSKVYYYNKEEKVTQWTKPPEYVIWYNQVCNNYLKSISSSWRQYTDKKGKLYYANKSTSATAWAVPTELEHFAEFRTFVLRINGKSQLASTTGDASVVTAAAGATTATATVVAASVPPESKKRKAVVEAEEQEVELAQGEQAQHLVSKAMKVESSEGADRRVPVTTVPDTVTVPAPISALAAAADAEAKLLLLETAEIEKEKAAAKEKAKGEREQELLATGIQPNRAVVRPAASVMDLDSLSVYLCETPDAVLDTGVLSYIERYLALSKKARIGTSEDADAGRDPASVRASMSESGLSAALSAQYTGHATLCLVVSHWSALLRSYATTGGATGGATTTTAGAAATLGISTPTSLSVTSDDLTSSHQSDILFDFLSGVIKQKFNSAIADKILDRDPSLPPPGWLNTMLQSPRYRRLLLELFVSDTTLDEFDQDRPTSRLLERCVELMLARGHVVEVCSVLAVQEVRSVHLCKELIHALILERVGAGEGETATTAEVSSAGALSLCKLVAANSACYVYAMELVHGLIRSYTGDRDSGRDTEKPEAEAASSAASKLPVMYRLHRLRETLQSVAHINDWKVYDGGEEVSTAVAAMNKSNKAQAVGVSTAAWWLQQPPLLCSSNGNNANTTVNEKEMKSVRSLVFALSKDQTVSDSQIADLHALAQMLPTTNETTVDTTSSIAPTAIQGYIADCLHLQSVSTVLTRRFMKHSSSGSGISGGVGVVVGGTGLTGKSTVAEQQLAFIMAVAYVRPTAVLVPPPTPAVAAASYSASEVEGFLLSTRAQCHALVDMISTNMGTVQYITTAVANRLHAATLDLLDGYHLEVSVISHCILEWIAMNAQATADKKQFSIGSFHALLPAYLSLVLGIFSASSALLQLECVSLLELILSPALAPELTASASLPHQSEDLVRHCLSTLVHMLGLCGRQLGGGDAFVTERIFNLVRVQLTTLEPEMVRHFFQQLTTHLKPPFADSYQHFICQLLMLPQSYTALSKTLSLGTQSARSAQVFVEHFTELMQWMQYSLTTVDDVGSSSLPTPVKELTQTVLMKYGKLAGVSL